MGVGHLLGQGLGRGRREHEQGQTGGEHGGADAAGRAKAQAAQVKTEAAARRRRGVLGVQCGGHSCGQAGRGVMIGRLGADGVAEHGGVLDRGLAFGAGLQVARGGDSGFAVQRPVHQRLALGDVRTGHGRASAGQAALIRARARAKRDMTVPIGAPVISAISR